MISQDEFAALAAQGLQPHSGRARGAVRPRHAAVGVPEARRRAVHLPARIGRRRRDLGPPFDHRPAQPQSIQIARAPARPSRNTASPSSSANWPIRSAKSNASAATSRCRKLPELPEFSGGLVGYFGFESIGYIEPKLAHWDRPDELGIPDVLLMLSDEVAVFDNLKGRLYLIVHADPARAAGVRARAAPPRRTRVPPAPLRAELSGSARSEGARGSRLQVELHARGISTRLWRRRRSTSAPATSSRSCRRSACRCRSARGRSMSIARCAR